MDNKRSMTTALAVVAIIGLGSLTLGNQGFPSAAEPKPTSKEQVKESPHEHSEEEGHAGESGHGDEKERADKDDHGDEAHGEKDHGSEASGESHEEEGKLELSAEQISTAGIDRKSVV